MLVLIADRRDLELTPPSSAGEALLLHEPAHRAVGDLDALAVQLLPDLLRAVDTVAVGLVHARDLGLQDLITQGSRAG